MVRKYAQEVTVLTYHNLFKKDELTYSKDPYSVSVENFEKQMEILYKNNFNTITLKQMEKYMRKEIKLPQKSILLTFDDGYKSYREYAYPILKNNLFKGAIFLITSKITNEHVLFNPKKTQYLSWNEIKNSKDVFDFASHTHDFHKWDSTENKAYIASKSEGEVANDLKTSMDLLQTNYFSYPFGHYDKRSLKILKKLGFTMAFTTDYGKTKPGDNMLKVKRIVIGPDTTIDELKWIVGIS